MHEDFYGLSFRPFDVAVDEAGYFPGLTFRKAITTIGHGLNKGGSIVLVTGAAGGGKTALLRHLRDKLEAEAVTLAMLPAAAIAGEDLLAHIARAFGLEDDALQAEQPLARLNQFLDEEARRGSRALLLIDDAQAITGEGWVQLQELARLRLGERALVQMVLAGDPGLADMLARREGLDDLRARLTVCFALEGLLPDEIGPYLDARLERAGWDGRPEFDPAIPLQLYRATAGNPGRINQAMTRLLDLGATEQQAVLEGDMLDATLGDMPELVQGDEGMAMAEGEGMGEIDDGAGHDTVVDAVVGSDGPAGDATPIAAAAGPAGLAEAQILAIEEAFGQRDRAFARLRREVEEMRGQSSEPVDAGRLSAIEARLDEQERVMRHLLLRMIAMFEQGSASPEDGSGH